MRCHVVFEQLLLLESSVTLITAPPPLAVLVLDVLFDRLDKFTTVVTLHPAIKGRQ